MNPFLTTRHLRPALTAFALLCAIASMSVHCLAQSTAADRPELVLQTGHSQPVNTIAFSPDGRWLVSGSRDHKIVVWDLASGLVARSLSGHNGGVNAVAFSPDGRYLASGSGDQTVKLWDFATGREICSFSARPSPSRDDVEVISVVFGPNGQWLGATTTDDIARRWSLPTCEEMDLVRPPDRGVAKAAAISPDGRWVVTGDLGGAAQIRDLRSKGEPRTITRHDDTIHALLFSPSGRWLLTESDGHATAKLWDLAAAHEVYSRPSYPDADFWTNEVSSFAFSRDEALLVRGNRNGLTIFDAADGRELHTFKTEFVHAAAFSPDARLLAAASGPAILLLDAATGHEVRTLRGAVAPVLAAAFSDDGRRIAFAGGETLSVRDYTVKVWDVAAGRQLHTLTGHTSEVYATAFSRDGRWLATGAVDKAMILWDVTRGQKMWAKETTHIAFTCISFSPDGRLVAAGDYEGQVRIWEVSTGNEVRTFDLPSLVHSPVDSVSFSPDGRWFAAASIVTTMVWDAASFKESKTIKAGGGLAFSRDGRRLASVDTRARGAVDVWDPETTAKIQTLCCHVGEVAALAFEPDGRFLISAGKDQKLIVWDLSTGLQLRSFAGHSGEIHQIAFSSDDRWLLTGSSDGTAKIWDVRDGSPRVTLVSLANGADWLAVAPDGLFDGTADAMRQVGWRMPKSGKVEALDNFFTDFYRPGLLPESLSDHPPHAQVDIAMAAQIPGLRAMLQQKQAHVEKRAKAVVVCFEQLPNVAVQAPVGLGVALPTEINGFRVAPADTTCKYQKELDSRGNPGDVANELQNWNRESVTSAWDGKPSDTSRSTLHVLTVAVSRYPDASGFDPLPYAVNSADLLENIFRKGRPGARAPYAGIHVWPGLHDGAATRQSIRARLAEIARTAKPDDVVVIYMAGHGIVAPGQEMFYFVPADGKDATIQDTGVSTAMLAEALRDIAARRMVLIIDACQSGGAVEALSKIGEVKVRDEERRAGLGTPAERQERGAGVHIVAATLPLSYAVGLKADRSALAATLLDALGGSGPITARRVVQQIAEKLPENSKRALDFAQVPLVSSIGLDFPLVSN